MSLHIFYQSVFWCEQLLWGNLPFFKVNLQKKALKNDNKNHMPTLFEKAV